MCDPLWSELEAGLMIYNLHPCIDSRTRGSYISLGRGLPPFRKSASADKVGQCQSVGQTFWRPSRVDEEDQGAMLLLGSRLRRCFGCVRTVRAASRVLVSVYMQPKTLSSYRGGVAFPSRRVLLTTKLGWVLVLFIVFFLIYTLLLVDLDKPFQGLSARTHTGPRPRLRFHGKGTGRRNLSWSSSSLLRQQRERFWDPAALGEGVRVSPVCRHGSLFVVLVTSTPDHFEHRRAIRATWCSHSLRLKRDSVRWQCLFLIGQTNASGVESRLREESRRYGDLLRGTYIDSYRNLTHKVMHGLSWVAGQCEAPYVLKTDDDCFANTVLLQQFLLNHNTQTSGLYAGGMVVRHERRKVIRRPSEKWSVTREDYAPDYYPMYASGSGYILSFDVVTAAVEESRYVRPIPNEDAYLGVLMEGLGVSPKHSGRFILSSSGLRVCNFLYVFVAHGVAPPVHQDMGDKMMAAQRDCSSKGDVTDW